MQSREERQFSLIVFHAGRRRLCRGPEEYIRGTSHRMKSWKKKRKRMKCSRKDEQICWYAWRRTLMQAEQSSVAEQ
jgi:hypothetical protein